MTTVPGFMSKLQVERVDDTSNDGRGTWVLLAPLVYLSAIAGRIVVPAGFVTDFASVPRLPIAFWLTGDCAHRAAVVHDWLYTTHETTRTTADRVFLEAAAVCEVPWWRRQLMYRALRTSGGWRWDAPGPLQPTPVQNAIEAA